MRKIFLAGNYHEEKLIFIQAGSSQVSLHSLPGGARLLKYFLDKELPGAEIIVLEDADQEIIEQLYEIRYFTNADFRSIRISRSIGYSVLPATKKIDTAPPTDAEVILADDANISPALLFNFMDQSSKDSNLFIINVTGKASPKNGLLSNVPDRHIEKIIAILHADDLRELGLQIDGRLSWDKTLETFSHEFNTNPIFNVLKHCKGLLIRFGLEAVLYISKADGEGTNPGSVLQQFRFFYIPSMYEGQLQEQTEGKMNGATEAFNASLLKKIVFPGEPTLTEGEAIAASIIPSMKAATSCLLGGYTKNEASGEIGYSCPAIFKENSLPVKSADLTEMMTAGKKVSLLQHHVFHSPELINYLAFRYVKEGISSSFDVIPYAEYFKIKTYDPDEIEGYRGLKARIVDYLSGNENKPLSIGVFGPPGSGKSFGVKQIAKFLEKKISVYEFNLSQFQSNDDLVNAFREISDINLSGRTPLIFFDEFDCDFEGKPLGWLIKFLAPMQDAIYKAGEKAHPFGRGVFVFAGGNFSTYQQFKALISDDAYKKQFGNDNSYISSLTIQQVKSAKIDDFDSRIKWHINIKGIDQQDELDQLYTLRRALVLRTFLTAYPTIRSSSGKINVDDDLLYALLVIPKFKHGTRSLETIINSCGLEKRTGFHKAHLPSVDQLKRDIDTIQLELLIKEPAVFPSELIEPMAQEIHERWLVNEQSKGSVKHTMKTWNELPDDMKDSNRQQAIDMIRKLKTLNYTIAPGDMAHSPIETFSTEEIEQMAVMEHDRWMNEKISKGWTYGKLRNDPLKIHDCLLPWNELDEKARDLDRNTVRIIPGLVKSAGFGLVKHQQLEK